MSRKSKESTVAFIVTLLLVLATGVAIYYFSANSANEQDLVSEKVRNEKLLSEKLLLAKEVDQLKSDIAGYKGKNSDLDKKLAGIESQLKQKEKQMTDLNKYHQGAVSDFKKQLSELQQIREQLNKEIARQNDQLAALKKENNTLKDAIASIEGEYDELKSRNNMLTQIISDNYGVEAHRKKDKLTINAKRTKEIELGFDVPAEMSENLSFTITSPEGKQLSSNQSKTITYAVLSDFEFSDETATASLSGGLSEKEIKSKKHVVLTYKPETRLNRGLYQISIFSEGTHIGSSVIRLK